MYMVEFKKKNFHSVSKFIALVEKEKLSLLQLKVTNCTGASEFLCTCPVGRGVSLYISIHIRIPPKSRRRQQNYT